MLCRSEASSSGEESVELMVTTREKRANAGNKMAQLLESAELEDEFYRNTYGGRFLEVVLFLLSLTISQVGLDFTSHINKCM